MAEGSDETAGIREDPVAGIERNDGFVVVSLAGDCESDNPAAKRRDTEYGEVADKPPSPVKDTVE